MRFSSILLALPLIGSAFAAPINVNVNAAVPVKVDIKRDVDVLAVVNKLKTTVTQVGAITVASTEQEVTVVLQTVNDALALAASELDVSVSAGIGLGIGLRKRVADVNEVAQILEEVLVTVNGLVGGIKQELRSLPIVAGLLKQLDGALRSILLGLEIILNGVLALVANLLAGLGININGLLGGVLGLLNPIVGGVLGTVVGPKGLLGGLL